MDLPVTINFTELKPISTYKLSVGIVLFIITWIILWEFLANLILPQLLKAISWVTLWISVVSIRLPYFILLILIWPCTGKKKLPKFLFISRKKNDTFSDKYIKKRTEFNVLLRLFDKLNRLTESSIGSEALLKILEYEKTWFIRSRIQQYYAAILFVFIGFSLITEIDGIKFYYYIILGFLIVLGGVIISVDNVFRSIDDMNHYQLVDDLDYYIFHDMVRGAIEDHEVIMRYDLEKARNRFILKLKPEPKEFLLKMTYQVEISTGASYEMTDIVSNVLERQSKTSTETLFLIVSDELPDVSCTNKMVENEIAFIYAENEEDILRGIDEIYQQLHYSQEKIDDLYGTGETQVTSVSKEIEK